MATSRALTLFSLCVAAGLVPFAAGAQQRPTDAPPQLERLEEGDAPAVTIKGSRGEQEITETRQQGRVTSIKVKAGDSTYYVKPDDTLSTAQPGDAQTPVNRAAQWQVLEFDWSRETDAKARADKEAAAQKSAAAEAVPPPPPSPQAK